MARVAVTIEAVRTDEGDPVEEMGLRREVAGRDFKLGMEALRGDELYPAQAVLRGAGMIGTGTVRKAFFVQCKHWPFSRVSFVCVPTLALRVQMGHAPTQAEVCTTQEMTY